MEFKGIVNRHLKECAIDVVPDEGNYFKSVSFGRVIMSRSARIFSIPVATAEAAAAGDTSGLQDHLQQDPEHPENYNLVDCSASLPQDNGRFSICHRGVITELAPATDSNHL